MGSWVDSAIWWQVYPLGFTGAEREALTSEKPVQHRLRHLMGWLDYAVELGCSGLLLGPVFASETHGYDTVDHFRIDPRLGDDLDFSALMSAAQDRGLRIALDGVFNHVGRGFPAFQAALAGGASASWFRREADGSFAVFEGHQQLIALNHEEPEVLDYVVEVMTHWLDRGIAGWRLDAAYAIPASFWRKALPKVRASYPDAWFLGEMIHGDYAAYAQASDLDSITQYELWKSVWSSLNDRNFFELAWSLERHNTFLDGVTPQTFVGNHDVTRLATQLTDERHIGHALAVLFTVGGIPSVYYGDEQAFRGLKEARAGGDDEIRPAFPAGPGLLAPEGWPVYRLHQRLIGFRRRHPWLVRARTTVLHRGNTELAFRSASPDGSGELLVLLNVGDEPFRFPATVGEPSLGGRGAGGQGAAGDGAGGLAAARDAVTPDPDAAVGDPLLVPAHSWIVLETA
jgi:cyclomaltodextrinase / maltogenic alpha-amylase / neopullulanase